MSASSSPQVCRAIDVLVADHVFEYRRPATFLAATPRHYTDPDLPDLHQATPCYTASMAAAWSVVAEFHDGRWLGRFPELVVAVERVAAGRGSFYVPVAALLALREADAAELLCRAALETLGHLWRLDDLDGRRHRMTLYGVDHNGRTSPNHPDHAGPL